MYTPITVESSYLKHDLGKTLYDVVMEKKPNIIVEFGCLYGYSTIAMAMALRDLGRGTVVSYDIWDKYQYKHTSPIVPTTNVKQYGLERFVEFRDRDFWEWADDKDKDSFDMLHLDISNDGQTILDAYNKLKPAIQKGSFIVFEGGSKERDSEEWMIKYNKRPINDINVLTNYTILNNQWPSISIINE